MKNLLNKLTSDYPNIKFTSGNVFFYSPKNNEVTYIENIDTDQAVFSLMHELAHAELHHQNYNSDFELLQLEVSAWEKACTIAIKYGYSIDSDHIQDCLDTYRDWLHQRSTCPNCKNQSFQKDVSRYRCFNCHAEWKVSSSVLCRPYRLLKRHEKETPLDSSELQATFL